MLARLLRDARGASAAEFALILPAALLLLFGVIDVGRYAWQLNEYEKAVQLGTRYAVATNVVSKPLRIKDFTDSTLPNCPGKSTSIAPGETICAEAMRPLTCTAAAGCVCGTGTGYCGSASGTDFDTTAFDNIYARMRVASKRIAKSQVQVIYTGSGVGYAGDPAVTSNTSVCTITTNSNGSKNIPDACKLPDVAPIVTVKLTGMRYYPITLGPLDYGVRYPDFSYSLILEDGDGTVAS